MHLCLPSLCYYRQVDKFGYHTLAAGGYRSSSRPAAVSCSSAEDGMKKEMEIFANAYLTLENGEERDTLYVDAFGITDALAYSVTYNSFFNE